MRTSTLRPLVVCCASVLAACASETPPPPPVFPAPPPVATPVLRSALPLHVDDARFRCAGLGRSAPPGVTVSHADFVSDGIAYPLNWATRRIVGQALPEHCRVDGRVDGDGTAATPAIAFEMRLPTAWNGRYLGQGSDDAQAGLVEAYGRGTGADGLENNALSQGFAVMSSDAATAAAVATDGPVRDPATGSDALERAALAAKAVIATYYGKPPDRSYFVGCSEGGREGLLFAQRWPSVFDGIVAVAPALRRTDAALAAAWTLQRFSEVAPRSRKRQPVLSRAFSAEELFGVAQEILAQCDALDGARDGFVMDMAGCRFEPSELACRRGKGRDCLRKAKVQALGEALAGPQEAQGHPLYAPWPWDPGIAAPGWRAWTLGFAGPGEAPDARYLTREAADLGQAFAHPPDPGLNAMNFDFGRDLLRMLASRSADAAFVNAPLDAFRERDGKLLLVHGAADPVVSAWATVDYQRRLDAALARAGGRSSDTVRTFVVPGMNHCAGGPATDRFDALAAVVDWFEFDRAPQRIEARGSAVLQDETRPLCPWPQVARYRGSGSLHDSASYECR